MLADSLLLMDAPKRRNRFSSRVCYGCLFLFVTFEVVFVLSFAHRESQAFPSLDNLLQAARTGIARNRTPRTPQLLRLRFFMTFDDHLSEDEAGDEYCKVIDTFGCEAFEQFRQTEREDDFRWIRLEKETDAAIQGVQNRGDVHRIMDQVKSNQSQYGLSDLYPRHWIPTPEDGVIYSDKVNGLGENANREFSVMQFNALAEGLSSGPSDKKPFLLKPGDKTLKVNSEKSVYGGFTAIPNPSVVLDFSLRRWRILEVIIGSNLDSSFDLIALEEIDRYRGFFLPMLRMFGYEGRFIPKARAPGLFNGWYSDGCCLFWKKETFQLISELRREYSVGNQVYIVASLRHKATGRVVVVAVTHLKAQRGDVQEKVRCHQVEELLDEVSSQSRLLLQQGEKKLSVLMLGDFNAEPPTAENTGVESAAQRVLEFGVDTFSEGGSKSPIRSAYDLDSGGFYTTWKIRGTAATKRIIDYIFYSGSLSCRATLQVPNETQLEPAKLPGLRHPSDHMMIAAKFRLE